MGRTAAHYTVEEAAAQLGLSPLRVKWLVVNRKLRTEISGEGQAGITAASLEAEIAWRRAARLRQRLGRVVGYLALWSP